MKILHKKIDSTLIFFKGREPAKLLSGTGSLLISPSEKKIDFKIINVYTKNIYGMWR